MDMSVPKLEKKVWYALDVTVEVAASEAVEYALIEAGSLGTETSTTHGPLIFITGYFDLFPDRERMQNELFEALRIYDLPKSSLREIKMREVEDRDWLAEWKKGWQPVQLGRFIIAPPWIESVPPASAGGSGEAPIVIQINPGMAFGTGTHETTRLCLKAIEKYFRGGSFLDVGTGTGILTIAASKLFPEARVEACDIDPEAIVIAKA